MLKSTPSKQLLTHFLFLKQSGITLHDEYAVRNKVSYTSKRGARIFQTKKRNYFLANTNKLTRVAGNARIAVNREINEHT